MLRQNINHRDLGLGTPKSERKTMNNQFDELTKGLAQSVTRRAALKKFGFGFASMALACFEDNQEPQAKCVALHESLHQTA